MQPVVGDYPLGRTKAWSTVVGSCLLIFFATGLPTAFGVFQDFYTLTWLNDSSASKVSWIGSTQLFFELSFAPIAGSLFDSKHFRASIITGCALVSISMFALSFSKQNKYYQVFLSQGIGVGLGISLLYLPTAAVVSQHFRSRRSLALGIVSSSASLGGVVFSIMLNKLLHGTIGFAWAVRITSFIILGCSIVGNLLIVEPKLIHSQPLHRKEEHTALPIWDLIFALILISAFIASLGTYFPIFYIQLFAKMHGIDDNLAFYSVAILNAACMIGRVGLNLFADRFGPMNVLIVCLSVCGGVVLAMFGCTRAVGLVLFAILLNGFPWTIVLSVYLPTIAALRQDNVDIGKRMGISLAPIGIAYLIGSPIIGVALGPNFSWWKGIIFAATTMIIAVIILVIVKFLSSNVLYRRRG
ncbi:MFS general substrate transporter [Fomitiporia mediterranea MF3/22]|uniref:MFS general substrate transporter n=1 Tax=Fomitiporia mediterranea (strain MF3/22) TaxID=694068 RepID=UPI0004407601|nr:MFS general substrate transporter [Fomitiporia mediterranea MF3/22]EJD00237.1 MFS general substrate transporter [Fomitiporia mediterranea MF3/22]